MSLRILMYVLVFLLSLVLATFVGPTWISPLALFEGSTLQTSKIFWNIRVPRVLLGALVGGVLAVSGLVFQSLFRNALATPYTLGVASAASFGAVLAICLFSVGSSSKLIFVCALGTALALTLVLYLLLAKQISFMSESLLLAGVAVNFFFASLILFVQFLGGMREVYTAIHWLMGGLSNSTYGAVLFLAPISGIGFFLIWYLARELDLMWLGDLEARSRGVAVEKVARIFFLIVSIMLAAVVAVSGPIGFIGMMVPLFCRLIFSFSHRLLVPMSFLVGAVFLVVCDALARSVFAPAEMPVGIITALLGAPCFLVFLIFRNRVS